MIVPWNIPLATLFQKLPFAFATGCSVIKPSELTSGTALEVTALAGKAGVPASVINVVTGTGARVGDTLVNHPDVQMISFTGSSDVGRRIAHTAGEQLKRASLELGGKAANVVSPMPISMRHSMASSLAISSIRARYASKGDG